jgi:protein-S-isoprenylcysteine O-methyltransferase
MNPKVVNSVLLAGFYAGIMALGDPALWTSPKLYILWVVGVLALIYQPAFEKLDRGSTQDRGTAMQILWTIQLTQIAGILEAVFLRYPESFSWGPWAWAGLGILLAGLALRSWSVIHLGKAFTWHIDPGQAETLITSGPYSVVRHPSYTGAYLLYTGTLVFVGAWFALPACMVGMVFAFVRRIRHEEAALEAKFGTVYADYRKGVGAVVPWL